MLRRRFQFRLRTLLLLFAGMSLVLGREMQVMREHKAMLARVVAAGGGYSSERPTEPEAFDYDWKDSYKPSLIRRWLGEPEIHSISIPWGFPKDEEKRVNDMFPGAYVSGYLL